MAMSMKVTKSPTEQLALTNCVIVNPLDVPSDCVYVTLNSRLFSARMDATVPSGFVGLSSVQRGWLQVALNEAVSFDVFTLSFKNAYAASLSLEVRVRNHRCIHIICRWTL